MAEVGQADVMFVRKHPASLREIFPGDRRRRLTHRFFWAPLRAFPRLTAVVAESLGAIALWMAARGMENGFSVRLFREAAWGRYQEGVSQGGGIPKHQRATVLAYHAVSSLPAGSVVEGYGIPPSEFERQIDELLASGYHFIAPDEFLRFLAGQAGLPRRALLLTFDDGYADLPRVVPILETRSIPAIVFVVTGRIGQANLWDQAIGAPALPLLDVAGLKSLAKTGFEIGLHSRTHPFLPRLDQAALKCEIAGGITDLQQAGLGRARMFAYPYGAYDLKCQEALSRAGIDAAFTVEPGTVKKGVNPLAIPRFEITRGTQGWRLLLQLRTGGIPQRMWPVMTFMLRSPRRFAKAVWRRIRAGAGPVN